MKPKKQFSPQNLRALLTVLLVLLILGGGAAFYWGLGLLRTYAIEVNHRLIDAEASTQQMSQLQALRAGLAQNSSLIEKANQLFAAPGSYRTQVQNDINNYANAAGLSLAETTFADDTNGTYGMTIKLNNPVRYTGLISFLNNIEGSLPKLQVSSMTIGPSKDKNVNTVNVEEIIITISVR